MISLNREYAGSHVTYCCLSKHSRLKHLVIIDFSEVGPVTQRYLSYCSYNAKFHESLYQELKKALAQLKTGTKITRNQLKFIELVLGVDKSTITFHTFAVLATMIDHMAHKE